MPEKKNNEKLVEPEIKDSPQEIKEVVVRAKEKIYWSRAARYRLDGWVLEKKTAGYIDSPSQALKFEEHVFVTAEKDKHEFIEGSKAFRRNDIILCENIEQARKLTTSAIAVRNGLNKEKCEDVTNTDIKLDGD
jgi:hypothetical protein